MQASSAPNDGCQEIRLSLDLAVAQAARGFLPLSEKKHYDRKIDYYIDLASLNLNYFAKTCATLFPVHSA
jgi:hypothetical protein